MHKCGLKDLYLYFCLTIEFRFVSDYLQCYHLFLLVIKGFENLAERAVTKSTYHFVPICYGIASCYSSLTLFIGKIFEGIYSPFANIKNLVPKYFFLLKRCQEGVLLFFFCLFHLDGVTPFIGRFIFDGVWGVDELNRRKGTFSVCILNDRNLDLV